MKSESANAAIFRCPIPAVSAGQSWKMRARMSLRSAHRRRQAHERFVETAHIEIFYLVLLLAFRLLPYGFSVMRPHVGEALAYNPLNCERGALYVIYAQADTIAIAEIELRSVPMQMLLAAVLINAAHAALEDREVTFR